MEEIRVLLVDDEQELATALAERLQLRKLSCTVAFDGSQALGMVRERPPHVMILDLKMPGLDGLEVLERVKISDPEVEVIVLTGHGSDRDERIARRLGAYEYLNKPVDMEPLLEAIRGAHRRFLNSAAAARAE